MSYSCHTILVDLHDFFPNSVSVGLTYAARLPHFPVFIDRIGYFVFGDFGAVHAVLSPSKFNFPLVYAGVYSGVVVPYARDRTFFQLRGGVYGFFLLPLPLYLFCIAFFASWLKHSKSLSSV